MRKKPAAEIAAISAAAAGYLGFLVSHAAFAGGGSDSSGYLNAARGFFSGHVVEPVVELARLGLGSRFLSAFIPLGYVPGPRPETMAPLYPPGTSLHMAAALLFGPNGPHWVPPLAALASAVLIGRLGLDMGLPRPAALAASLILAAQPLLVFVALQPLSDAPAEAWCLGAVVAARRSRSRPADALVAGLAAGIAFLIRPAAILVAFPVLIFVGRDVRRLGLLAAGAAGPAIFLLAYDRAAFGHVFSSGYLASGHASAFAWSNFPERARYYAHWLSATLTGLVLAGWLVALGDRRVPPGDRVALGVWPLAFFVFYAFYLPYRPWTYVRFLLPAMPALIVGFLLGGRRALAILRGTSPVARVAVAALAVAIVVSLEIRQIRRLRVLAVVADERTYPDACAAAAATFSPDALVLSMAGSGALRYYTNLSIARSDLLNPRTSRVLEAAMRARRRPIAALLFPGEEEECFRHFPGAWRPGATVGAVTLWTLP